MNSKPYPFFGHVLMRNELSAGEIITDDSMRSNRYKVDKDFKFIWLQTSGHIHDVEINTGATQDRYAGDSTLSKPEPDGSWEMSITEDAVVWCYSPIINIAPVTLTHFALADGQSVNLAPGTQLFLCDGVLSIGVTTVAAPKQLRVDAAGKTVTAVGNCLGLIFNA